MHYRYGIITRYAFIDGAIEVIVPSTGDFNSLLFTVPIICPAVIFSSNSTAVLNMPFSGEEIINGTAGTIVVCVETVGVIVPRTTDTVFLRMLRYL